MKRRVRAQALWLLGASLMTLACQAAVAQSDAPFHEPTILRVAPPFVSASTRTYRVDGVVLGVRRAAVLNDDRGETHIVTLGEQLPDGYRVKRINLQSVVLEARRRRLTLRAPR